MIIERTGWTFAEVDALGNAGRQRLHRAWATLELAREANRRSAEWERDQSQTYDNMKALGHVRD